MEDTLETAKKLFDWTAKKSAFPESQTEIQRKFLSDVYHVAQGYIALRKELEEKDKEIARLKG